MLKKITLTDGETTIQDIRLVEDDCGICFERMSIFSSPTKCGHNFCSRCITQWKSAGNSTCPMCRQEL